MGIFVNSVVMIVIGILNCGPDIILCKYFMKKTSFSFSKFEEFCRSKVVHFQQNWEKWTDVMLHQQ